MYAWKLSSMHAWSCARDTRGQLCPETATCNVLIAHNLTGKQLMERSMKTKHKVDRRMQCVHKTSLPWLFPGEVAGGLGVHYMAVSGRAKLLCCERAVQSSSP
jgi:hypothetical protein